MTEKQGSFRTTISVPGELKARMGRVKEPVNWSALACSAFEDKLAEIAARKETKVMNDVVERLRATLRNESSDAFNEGYEAGTKWAENTATAAELKRLESFQKTMRARSGRDWGEWFRSKGNHLPWLELVKVIQNNKNLRPPTGASAFWKTVRGESSQYSTDGDFLRGFVVGAVDLWTRVQEQL